MVLLFYLTAAVIWDFTTFRIPNYFIFFGLILGASLLPFRGYGIQEILLGCLCPVVFLYPLFCILQRYLLPREVFFLCFRCYLTKV